MQPAATAWSSPRRLIDDYPVTITRWWHDPEAALILQGMEKRAPDQEREHGGYDGESVRFLGQRAARLEAIRSRYCDTALARSDFDGFGAQRPVAWLILDRIDGLETALAPVQRVSETAVAA